MPPDVFMKRRQQHRTFYHMVPDKVEIITRNFDVFLQIMADSRSRRCEPALDVPFTTQRSSSQSTTFRTATTTRVTVSGQSSEACSPQLRFAFRVAFSFGLIAAKVNPVRHNKAHLFIGRALQVLWDFDGDCADER